MLQFPPWKIWLVSVICALGVLFALPNVIGKSTLESLPSWLPHNQVSLGLDLRGGVYLLLQVDTQAYVSDRMAVVEEDMRRLLRDERLGVRVDSNRDGVITMTLRNAGDAEQAQDLLGDVSDGVEVVVAEGGRITATLTEQGRQDGLSDAVDRALEVIGRRINETGVREPIVQRQGADRILVQVPGVENPEQLKDILGQTAKLTFRIVDVDADLTAAQNGQVPLGSELLAGKDEGTSYVVSKRIMVSGESLTGAQAAFDQGRPVVSFSFDTAGARRFCDATTENIGQPMAIVLDDEVISAPRINGAICQGRGIITGNFTVSETNELALLLRAGALPVPMDIVEERTVGPSLGADSIRAGEVAAVIGFAAVVIFMLGAYGLFGIFANVALLANIILILGAMSLLQATLTLPGIAGIVLTVGMAVDANVLIFERIREEVRNGRTPFNAVDTGFKRAMSTIIDSNLTTILAAGLLFGLGSGPVRGFGVTLAIGIVTSMFTAIMVTRLQAVLWLRRKRPQTLPL
jgi:preprotein translocase subunit SecD